MSLDILIAHAAWEPARKASLERLLIALPGTPLISSSIEREHANVWARRLWSYAPHTNASHVVFLNDDVIPHPGFHMHVSALVELLPNELIALHCQFPGIADAARSGHRLGRCYWPSGPAYVMPRWMVSELIGWLDTVPPQWWGGPVNEDGVLASFLWSKQRPAYCSIPALVRHDTTVPSTLGYDLHPGRKSPVDWAEFQSGWVEPDVGKAPYVETPWMSAEQYRQLGDALRGVVPLCGFCLTKAGTVTNELRKTGICYQCHAEIARHLRSRMSVHVQEGPAPGDMKAWGLE